MRTGVLYGGEAETFGFGRTECAAFTGYRPAKFLAAFPQGDARQRVGELLRPVVAGLYDLGVRLFLSGMAEGFDLWAAAEVLALRDRGRMPRCTGCGGHSLSRAGAGIRACLPR